MTTPQLDSTFLDGMKFRCIGPPRGGRVLAVAGHPTRSTTFYFGACAGGVWKSDDGGLYWENISDGFFNSAAVGAIAVAESDPNVIYVGAGEATIRGDVSYGDGVYKSTDGGRTWSHMGLSDSHHIAKIRIHPTNPDLVYVAALGHGFGPNQERGVYRSQDGGASWEQVLYASDKAGAVDISMDPTNPRILYAAIYETVRNFWSLSSGGPDSGLWKSTDGGDTWTDITGAKGLPDGLKGKIGVAISPARPSRVWAIIEAEGDKAGLYRSDDHGETWAMVSNNRDLIHRPWYYCHIFADPQDPETVYVLDLNMWKSTDGGANWEQVTTPHGDNHDLWIDPRNPRRMIEGNDGGACVSFNGGESWTTIYNQSTAQFYHLDVDNQYPYRVYGTQQDNSSISVPSRTEKGAIPWGDCYAPGTGESGYIAVHPQDPNIVYVGAVGSSPGGGGALQRYDHRTKQVRLITVWPEAYQGYDPAVLKYRFAWTFPIVFSPHDPGILYAGGNHVFRTTDEGDSWEVISPDLSRNDPQTLKASGGPLTLDTSGAENYGTVFAFAESYLERGVLWAGSDDGLVHVSRDDGATWTNVTPPDLPEFSLISLIEPSRHDPGTVYVAATRYKLDDYHPLLYKTEDYGQRWRALSDNFPEGEITRAVREDPVQPGLLYVGAETGLFVSLDDGAHWLRWQGNLPVAPVYDLKIKDNDLVIATHGRSFWILDDLTPLRQVAAGAALDQPILFPPVTTVRHWDGIFVGAWSGPGKNYMLHLGAAQATYKVETDEYGEPHHTILDGGENPPNGAIVYYTLPTGTTGEESVSLTFFDADGNEIRRFEGKAEGEALAEGERALPIKPGLNRFVWDLRYPDAAKIAGDPTTEKARTGPRAAPGRYQVELSVGDQRWRSQFELIIDPRLDVSQDDLDAQFELGLQIRDKVNEVHEAAARLRWVRVQIAEWASRATASKKAGHSLDDVIAQAEAIQEKLTAIEHELVQTEARAPSDRLRLKVRLNQKLITLISVVAAADARPTRQSYDVFAHLAAQADEQLAALERVLSEDVAAFVALLEEQGAPLVVIT